MFLDSSVKYLFLVSFLAIMTTSTTVLLAWVVGANLYLQSTGFGQGYRGALHIERGDRHGRRPESGDDGALVVGRPAGGDGRRAGGRIRRKYFPLVGDVRPYGFVYQGGIGGQMVDRQNYQVRRVQHL